MKTERTARAPRLRPLAACVAMALALGSTLALGDAHDTHGTFARTFEARTALRNGARDLLAGQSHFMQRARDVHAPAGPTPTVVENCADDGPGSLRQAYRNAASNETIDLSQLTCSTITLTSGALEDSPTTENVMLQGPGKYLLTIDGGNADRVIVHNGPGSLLIGGVTIQNGSYTGPNGGGCIYSHANVELFDVLVTGCTKNATGTDNAFGGGVYADGRAYVRGSQILDNHVHSDGGNAAGGGVWGNAVASQSSTISGNSANTGDGSHYARGGGLFSVTDTEISYSTISGNVAGAGGGIFLVGGAVYPMEVLDSTISGNSASGAGGGVYAKYRQFAVSNSTITQNSAGAQGGGMFLTYATDLDSTIVANNSAADGATADIGSTYDIVLEGSNNLVLASNVPLPPDTLSVDPMLGPLQDNGGASMTHALLPGSPAIDHGSNPSNGLFEQRLFDLNGEVFYERLVGPAPDIGAFEFGAPDRLLIDGFEER
ncbi:MAG: choice-of-anchor Q domain-containing protein [Rhodanobacteraceae bacterium]